MNIDHKNARESLWDKLSRVDDKLQSSSQDTDLVGELRRDVSELLSDSGHSDEEVRNVLEERVGSGSLRQETYQLVMSVLAGVTSESIPTSPSDWVAASTESELMTAPNDDFGTTTIIPVGVGPAGIKSNDVVVQVGSVLRDRFVLQEKIAGGSMGVVYKALDRRLAESGSDEQWVAIKVLAPTLAENAEALRALQQEAAKGRSLVHPNIVRFIDLDRDGELYFIVLEWMEGRTLAEILDSNDRVSIDRDTAIKIFRQIGAALDHAHRCGIVHADIKPGNIMILEDGSAKLFDFGVARLQQQQFDQSFDPGVLGALTPAYSSMQVLTGEEPVAADDVFSLACLVYRLVAGYRVFGPRNAAEAAEEGMEPQKPQGFNDGQWSTVKKALSFVRITRYETVREFLDAFEGAANDEFVVEVPERLEISPADTSDLRIWGLAALLIGTAAFGYWGGYYDRWLPPNLRQAVLLPSGESSEARALSDSQPELDVARLEEPTATISDSTVIQQPDLPTDVPLAEEPSVGPVSNIVDFSTLPTPTLEIAIERQNDTPEPVDIAVREDGAAVIVDFIRNSNLERTLRLRLDEVGFSGNRSPWASGQFAYSNGGIVTLPAGQTRGRIELTMASDPLREADQFSTLRLRDVESSDAVYALLSVTLEDDDQRRFEAQLEPNTIAFAASQASVRETDPAVQIDLVRFNPDETTVTAQFVVTDITATQGEDYFSPGGSSVRFGPGQRSARLLIPLVQDSLVEGDEAFIMQLEGSAGTDQSGVYRRIAVMIRDDEPQAR